MRKILSLVLVLALVLGSFSFAFAAPSDVVGTEYEDAVERLSTLGVLTGYPDGTFKPNNTITRAEFSAAVVRILNLEPAAKAAKGATSFTDVPATHWASGYVNIASKMGYVKGMGDGTFAPEAPITYEQAVTLVMRALGYEEAAISRGGYPYGYLVVAHQEGLTDDVDGTQGLPAPRGLVAQLLDNALEIPMMVQVGYGSDSKWVKSGTEDTDEVYLLDELGFDKESGRVVDYDADENEIELEGYGVVVVSDDFDFEAAYGLELTVWLDGDDVILYTVDDEPMFDAVEGGEDEITLVDADDDYDVAKDATLILNGEEVDAEDFTADYAKVVLNDDDEVIWAQGFTFDDFLVVEEIEDGIVYSYGDELDIDGFIVVKDGKTAEVEEGDILFFNEDAEYAVVYNNSEKGELERVYEDSFKFEGTVYNYDAGNYDVKYLDEDEFDVVDEEVLDAMMDEDENVTVYFDFAGNAILVVGDQGEPDTDYFYALVTYFNTYTETNDRTNESTDYIALDILNEEGDIVEYDLEQEDFEELSAAADDVVKVTVDEDGEVVEVEVLEAIDIENVEIDGTYAEGYRLQDSAIVFLANADDYEDYGVFTWGEAEDEFSEVYDGVAFIGSNGRIVAILATDTDADDAIETHTGLVTKVRKLSSDEYEVTIEIAGEEFEYITEQDMRDYEEQIVTIDVDQDDEIVDFYTTSDEDGPKAETGLEITSISTSKKTITVGDSVYELVDDAVIYDVDFDEISIRDLEEGDTIDVYFVNEDTTRFVSYVLRTDLADPDNNETVGEEGEITYINSTYTKIVVDGKTTYTFDSNTEILDEDGNIIAVGYEDIENLDALQVGDVVTDIVVEDGVVKSLVLVSQE